MSRRWALAWATALGCVGAGGLAFALVLARSGTPLTGGLMLGALLMAVLMALHVACTALPLSIIDRFLPPLFPRLEAVRRIVLATVLSFVPVALVLGAVSLVAALGARPSTEGLLRLLIICYKAVAPLSLFFTYWRVYQRPLKESVGAVAALWVLVLTASRMLTS